MEASGTGGQDLSLARAGIPLLAAVRLDRPLRAEGEILPAGASGTIVEVLDEGRAYVVEFSRPRRCVVTVRDEALTMQAA